MNTKTKFWIGDVVYGIRSGHWSFWVPCTDCAESGKIQLPSGKVNCPTCYGRRGKEDWKPEAWKVTNGPMTVGDVRFKCWGGEREEGYMCDSTGIGTGSVWRDDQLWPSREAAEAECERLNELMPADEVQP